MRRLHPCDLFHVVTGFVMTVMVFALVAGVIGIVVTSGVMQHLPDINTVLRAVGEAAILVGRT